jgi:hypothetical protein
MTSALNIIKQVKSKPEHKLVAKGIKIISKDDNYSFENCREEFLNGESDYIGLYTYDKWDMSKTARTDFEMLQGKENEFATDVNNQLPDKDYFIGFDGDWDTGDVTLFYKPDRKRR